MQVVRWLFQNVVNYPCAVTEHAAYAIVICGHTKYDNVQRSTRYPNEAKGANLHKIGTEQKQTIKIYHMVDTFDTNKFI